MFTIGSLFSGIGGLELGLERAGLGPVLWQVERDSFCRRVLAKHWPDAERFDDVRAVGASVLRRVDVICGGFPCQPVSLAGKGLAQADERWLWPEVERIVGELAPRFVVVENVPGLVRRGLADVVAGLDRLGYAVVGTRIAASDVGAPHKRERLFLVAYADGPELRHIAKWVSGGRPRGVQGQGQAVAEHDGHKGSMADAHGKGQLQQGRTLSAKRRWSGNGGSKGRKQDVSHAHGARLEERSEQPAWEERAAFERGCSHHSAWAIEPEMGRVAHGVSRRVDQLRALGNAVVPQVAEVVGEMVLTIASSEMS